MLKYKFNDKVFPRFSFSEHDYSVIVKTKTRYYDTNRYYYLFVSSTSPFQSGSFINKDTGLTDSGIVFSSASETKIYFTYEDGSKWTFVTDSFSDEADFIKISDIEDYCWSNSDIVNIQTGEADFSAGSSESVEGANAPTEVQLPYQKTYEQYDLISPIFCQAQNDDEGVLTYEWYQQDVGLVATGEGFYPSTDVLGTQTYYCIVVNTLNEISTIKKSSNLTVYIKEQSYQVDNNFSKILGQLIGTYARRQFQIELKEPIVDLDFYNYRKNSEWIPNKGTGGEDQEGWVYLNSGEAYYEPETSTQAGLVLTKNANFIVPNRQFQNNEDSRYTWIVGISNYKTRAAKFCRVCRTEEDAPSVFYYGYAQKFCVKLSALPYPGMEGLSYNEDIITYDESKGFIYDLKPGDVIGFTCDGQTVYFYINGIEAMSMPRSHMTTDFALTIGCGDTSSETDYYFDFLKINKFVLYDVYFKKDQMKKVMSGQY